MRNKILTGALVVFSVAFIGAGAVEAAETAMKIANVLPAKAPRSRGAILVAKMVNEDQRCDLKARTTPAGNWGERQT